MHKLFTSEDVISFAYNEMPADEAVEFCAELNGCPEMASELETINEVRIMMDATSLVPQAGVVQAILNYSRSLKIQKETFFGAPLEVVLN